MADNPLRPLVEKNVALVEKYYPGLRFSDRHEWTHKVAYLCYKECRQVGQKSTSADSPVSEDTIGITEFPINGTPGADYYPMTFEAVDLVQGTTGKLQWLSFGYVSQNFIIPTVADVSAIPDNPPNPNPQPPANTVPWVPYDENGFQELKRTLAYDYARRPQGADFDVTVWAARVFHSSTMGPEKVPLGKEAAMNKHRPEWCGALGVPVIPVPPNWNIGDPV